MLKRSLFSSQGKPEYSQMTLPSRQRGHRGDRGLYTPITADQGVIYAKVDKGKKSRRPQEAGGGELSIFPLHASGSSSSSVRQGGEF